MTITVKIVWKFGARYVYPECVGAKIFCLIANTKTLTNNMMGLIHELGYEIVTDTADGQRDGQQSILSPPLPSPPAGHQAGFDAGQSAGHGVTQSAGDDAGVSVEQRAEHIAGLSVGHGTGFDVNAGRTAGRRAEHGAERHNTGPRVVHIADESITPAPSWQQAERSIKASFAAMHRVARREVRLQAARQRWAWEDRHRGVPKVLPHATKPGGRRTAGGTRPVGARPDRRRPLGLAAVRMARYAQRMGRLVYG